MPLDPKDIQAIGRQDQLESQLDDAWTKMEGHMYRIIEISFHGPTAKDTELVGAMANLITAEYFMRTARKRIAALPTE